MQWESEEKCAQPLCSVSLGPRHACGIPFLSAPSRVRPPPNACRWHWPAPPLQGPTPPPRALAALPSVSGNCSPLLAPRETSAVRVWQSTAGHPITRTHTALFGQSSRCRAPRISPDFSPHLCVYEYWEAPLNNPQPLILLRICTFSFLVLLSINTHTYTHNSPIPPGIILTL